MSYKVSGSWQGTVDEEHPDLMTAQNRAQQLLAEHPNAKIQITGENFTGTVQMPAQKQEGT